MLVVEILDCSGLYTLDIEFIVRRLNEHWDWELYLEDCIDWDFYPL
jgi:hypothetical protein